MPWHTSEEDDDAASGCGERRRVRSLLRGLLVCRRQEPLHKKRDTEVEVLKDEMKKTRIQGWAVCPSGLRRGDVRRVTKCRTVAARAEYLGVARPDLQFVVKQACRRMASPGEADMKWAQRIVRYIHAAPKVVLAMPEELKWRCL